MEANTPIETSEGIVPLKEIEPGVSQIHVGGKWSTVTKLTPLGSKACYKLVDTRGRELRCPREQLVGVYALSDDGDINEVLDTIYWMHLGDLDPMEDPIAVSSVDGFGVSQILTRDFIGSRECYSLETEDGRHNFTANGYILKGCLNVNTRTKG